MTQTQLNNLFKKKYSIPIEILDDTFPKSQPYKQLNGVTSLNITAKELLHVIGTKMTSIPSNRKKECLRAAYFYALLLDWNGTYLGLKKLPIGSDLQTNRSGELGIAFGCLVASKLFNVRWDTLQPIMGRGKRFDYRATHSRQDHVYEFKGTKYLSKQNSQIDHGLDKKKAMHKRGEKHSVELIVSTRIGYSISEPRIVLADPPFDGLEHAFYKEATIFYKLRNLSRIAQFVGNIPMGNDIYKASKSWLPPDMKKFPFEEEKLLIEKGAQIGYIEERPKLLPEPYPVVVQNQRFIGRWVSNWLPPHRQGNRVIMPEFVEGKKLEVFQGAINELYQKMQDPFDLEDDSEISFPETTYTSDDGIEYTVFKDGTVMGYRLVNFL